ncbi:MAG: oligosaccharyl transferase, archaeosortase A system-associated [Vicinamibacterales bacterium]
MRPEDAGSDAGSAGPGLRTSSVGPALLVAGIGLVAFAVRVGLSYRAVLGQEFVSFIENDAWYHMRLVDGLIQRFPWRIWNDAYVLHPGGELVNVGPMFDWIVAALALIVGAGSPSPRTVDLVGAFVPPVFGALTVIPVYLIGRDIFSRRAGLFAAVSVAVMPGDILIRSALGFTDHHCAEVLFTTLALLCLVRAMAPERSAANRTRYALAAGMSLGTYLLTWGGGALFVAMVTAWGGLELIVARLRASDGRLIPLVVAPAFIVAAIMIAPWFNTRPSFEYSLLALGGGCAGLLALYALGTLTLRFSRGLTLYLSVIAVTILVVGIVALMAGPLSIEGLRGELQRMSPWRSAGYVTEATPLLRSQDWRPFPLWNQFTGSLVLALFALPAVTGRSVRDGRVRLLLVWGAVSLIATVGQVRFAYYLAVSVALLAGYACDVMLSWRFLDHPYAKANAVLLLTAAIAAPGAPRLYQQAGANSSLSPDWFDALQWIRSNTPEPYSDPDAYFTGAGAENEGYGVMTWWDYGYWVTRIARRPPNTNPRQTQVMDVADFYLSTEPERARELLDEFEAKYVIADASLAISATRRGEVGGFFPYIATVGGRDPGSYCQLYRVPPREDDRPVLYCFPEYFQTMAIRLYAFGGRAVTPTRVWAIDVDASAPGLRPLVRRERSFRSYEEALQFTEADPSGRWRVASKDTKATPIPLEALTGLTRVYQSFGREGRDGPAQVQIFEYRRVPQAVALR